MADRKLEVERKYDVDGSVVVPELHALPGAERVAQVVEHQLEAVYFDTADLRLATAGVTLRRRTGGEDEGWHLKLPAASGRIEEQRPLGRAARRVPVQLARLVRVHIRDAELVPVATLRTERRVHRLMGADGNVLAELCDDQVTATGPDIEDQAWREWELELVDGESELLELANPVLVESGATAAEGPSKLARALADRWPGRAEPFARDVSGKATTVDVFTAYAGAQVDAIRQRDPDVRQDHHDAVHKMRVATRRLRSALATYRKLLDAERSEHLRAELKWLAGELGGARDAEVMRDRLTQRIAAEPVDLVLGRVARTIEVHLNGVYKQARVQALAALDSERYFRLLDELEAFVSNPPWTASKTKARKELPALLQRDWKRVTKAVDQAQNASDPEQRDHQLHEARKAAKRLRYAAESATPIFASQAKDFAATAEQIQEILGEHQDSVVSRDLLRQLAIEVHLSGGNAFTYGRLHAFEQTSGETAQQNFWTFWKTLAPKPKTWS